MEWIAPVATAALALLALFGIINPLRKVAQEGREFLTALAAALEDDKLSKEEIKDLWEQAKDVGDATQKFWDAIRRKS